MLTQSVAVGGAKSLTLSAFNYTITSDDAAAGKVIRAKLAHDEHSGKAASVHDDVDGGILFELDSSRITLPAGATPFGIVVTRTGRGDR
jgi:hypothetical protein